MTIIYVQWDAVYREFCLVTFGINVLYLRHILAVQSKLEVCEYVRMLS